MQTIKTLSTEIALILLVILLAAAAFGLGRLSVAKEGRGTLKVLAPQSDESQTK